ncbi:MAG TPA: class I SAM-dependent methyltransferase [Acidobacteriota bacterium]|nr:class I SAM-dependent methyltransferase [Acidobacteriota bacterium]
MAINMGYFVTRRLRSWMNRRRQLTNEKSAADWNQEYLGGQWEFLSKWEEMGRYWIIAGYCALLSRPSVLDIGCGTGLLEEKLRLVPYSSYTGVDISETALRKARSRIPPACQLICTDFLNSCLRKKYDIIVFNEVFLPGMRAVEILEKYFKFLSQGGRIVLCAFDGRNHKAREPFWKEIRQHLNVEDCSRIEHLESHKRWTIALIAPHSDL